MPLTLFGAPIRTGLGPKAARERQRTRVQVARATGEDPGTAFGNVLGGAFDTVGEVLGPADVYEETIINEGSGDMTQTLLLAVVGVGAIAAVYQLSQS
jgi:hypothetical protein